MTEDEQIKLSDSINFIAQSIAELDIAWNKYLKKEYDEINDLSDRFYFEDMKFIAKFIVEKYKINQTNDFSQFFNALEEVFQTRDSKTCSCISAGLIEDIQAYNFIECETSFSEWLKPETRKWWNGAAVYWGNNKHKSS